MSVMSFWAASRILFFWDEDSFSCTLSSRAMDSAALMMRGRLLGSLSRAAHSIIAAALT